jgi:hypothetical protein
MGYMVAVKSLANQKMMIKMMTVMIVNMVVVTAVGVEMPMLLVQM